MPLVPLFFVGSQPAPNGRPMGARDPPQSGFGQGRRTAYVRKVHASGPVESKRTIEHRKLCVPFAFRCPACGRRERASFSMPGDQRRMQSMQRRIPGCSQGSSKSSWPSPTKALILRKSSHLETITIRLRDLGWGRLGIRTWALSIT